MATKNIKSRKRNADNTAISLTIQGTCQPSKKIGYNMDVKRQTACKVVKSIMIDKFASIFTCIAVSMASD